MQRRMHFHIDVDEFQQLWADGVPGSELAARYGISQTHICRLRRQYGFPDRDAPNPAEPPTPEDATASEDSLRFSPWVASRIRELGLGVRA